MSAIQRRKLSTAPRRAPLSSNYLPWLAPPRSAFKQTLIDIGAIGAACIFVAVSAVAIAAAFFILLFCSF